MLYLTATNSIQVQRRIYTLYSAWLGVIFILSILLSAGISGPVFLYVTPRLISIGLIAQYYIRIRLFTVLEVTAREGDTLIVEAGTEGRPAKLNLSDLNSHKSGCSDDGRLALETSFGNKVELGFRDPCLCAEVSGEFALQPQAGRVTDRQGSRSISWLTNMEILALLVGSALLVFIIFGGLDFVQREYAIRFGSRLGIFVGCLILIETLSIPPYCGLLVRELSIVRPSFSLYVFLRVLIALVGLALLLLSL